MIRPGVVWGVARAEARLCRRLVRYWVFQALATGFGLLVYAYYMVLHWKISSWSATAALINPRFLGGYLGIYYLLVFLIGLVFLGFDVRARDRRERISEVVDALPCTNLELLLGRFLGILLPSWIPVVLVSILFFVVGLPFKESIEPFSLVTFAVVMAFPAYCFVLGLTFLLTLILRHRLIAAVTLIGLLIGLVVVNFGFVPIYLLPAVDLTGGFSVPGPSDIVPRVIDLRGFMQRSGVLLAGLGMLLLAVAIHPRKDDSSRRLTAGMGLAFLAAAVVLCGSLVFQALDYVDRTAALKEAHEARRDTPTPDLLALSGEARIRPGRSMELDLTLRFAAREEQPLDTALFSLNPGLRVGEVRGASGAALSFEQGDGLLDIRLEGALPGGEETTVSVTAEGRPDPTFGYLDSVFHFLTLNIQDGNIFLLGYENLIFDRRYVALMPGARWLPASGAEIGRGDPEVRPTDLYELDLTVELPEGWLAAGPGRRLEAAGSSAEGRSRYRFAPPAPVPGAALVASRFASRSAEIGGVQLEALVHRSHEGSLEFFSDAAGEIRDWLGDRLREAADVGLAYPYDALTLVEVPPSLRGYAGGWRMDSTMSQPAMILTREPGFPTARFDTRFRNPERFRDQEGGAPRAKRDILVRFFENDFTGGNPFIAAARNFFGYQTAAAGRAGVPLEFVCDTLSTRLVTERRGYFSIHHMGSDLNQTMGRVMSAIFRSGQEDMAQSIIQAVTSRSEVWNALLDQSLAELDPWEEPERALDVLTVKGGAMAESMLDELGREKAGALLGTLRRRGEGATFDRQDVVEAGREVGQDLEGLLEVWIDQTDLPGFTLGEVRAFRLPDGDDGSPNYQLLVTLRNGEATPGLVRLDYRLESSATGPDRGRSDPLRVPAGAAVEVGLVTSASPSHARVVPYLALNREPFNVPLPAIDEERIVDEEPFVGVRQVESRSVGEGTIVVDDLDEEFSVQESAERSMWRFGGRSSSEELDQGLPTTPFMQRATRWSRMTLPDAYGKYRHTLAVVRAGEGHRVATFRAEIPSAGQWELEYYVPRTSRQGRSRRGSGTWNLVVADDSGEQQLTFDVEEGEPGWNPLGTLELAGGEVRVSVSDETDAPVVIADAIRWTPGSADGDGATR